MITSQNYASSEILFLVEEATDGGYFGQAMCYPILTEAATLEELHDQVREAVLCYFHETEVPNRIRLYIVKKEIIPI
jgi:hypothetical protein